jgi:hypothetical protein
VLCFPYFTDNYDFFIFKKKNKITIYLIFFLIIWKKSNNWLVRIVKW